MAKVPLDWEFIQKKKFKVSILIDNPLPEHKGKGKESYVGYILGFDNEFLTLETPNNNRIQVISIKWNMILSVWIYN